MLVMTSAIDSIKQDGGLRMSLNNAPFSLIFSFVVFQFLMHLTGLPQILFLFILINHFSYSKI